jgi:GTP pyrophosphokinase
VNGPKRQMPKPSLTKSDKRLIRELVRHYLENKDDLETFLKGLVGQVLGSKALRNHFHSIKWRMKDADHLRDKLERKILESKKSHKRFTVTPKNLFLRINDLAGLRILHLHTQQAEEIDQGLQALFKEEVYTLLGRPTARTWDDESRTYFKSINIRTKKSPSMYTSIHYVIKPKKVTKYTCEIQVRTLMEEVWGEVDHTLNYPHKTRSLACREQIATLARATSAATRLVDSIFRSHADFQGSLQKKRHKRSKTPATQK